MNWWIISLLLMSHYVTGCALRNFFMMSCFHLHVVPSIFMGVRLFVQCHSLLICIWPLGVPPCADWWSGKTADEGKQRGDYGIRDPSCMVQTGEGGYGSPRISNPWTTHCTSAGGGGGGFHLVGFWVNPPQGLPHNGQNYGHHIGGVALEKRSLSYRIRETENAKST